jgi:hypothetical protein
MPTLLGVAPPLAGRSDSPTTEAPVRKPGLFFLESKKLRSALKRPPFASRKM